MVAPSAQRLLALLLTACWVQQVVVQPTAPAAGLTGPCNDGGSRGWLQSVSYGYHPSNLFGPSGLHGNTFGIPVAPDDERIQLEVFPLGEPAAPPPASCCPEAYYPGREYRIRIYCPSSCAVLLSVEPASNPIGPTSSSYQVGSWRFPPDSRLLRYVGSQRVFNSLRSPIVPSEGALSTAYTAYWKAPAFNVTGPNAVAVRLTAVLDNGATCPGVFADYTMPSLVVCGDGYHDVYEECEDGNTIDGDGCSANCAVESGWTCSDRVTSPASGNLISSCTRAEMLLEPTVLAVGEGGTGNVTVRLTTFAGGVVFVQPTDLPEELSIAGDDAILRFTEADWATPRVVTLTVAENSLVEPNRTYSIPFDVSSTEELYSDLDASVFTLQVVDDDFAGVSLSRSSLVVNEFGAAEMYRVALTSEPRGFVGLQLSYAPSDFALLVNPRVLTFDRFNWAQGFEVSVRAPENPDAEGSIQLNITHAVDAELDADYRALDPALSQVAVEVLDNDLVGVFINPQKLVVTEGTTGTYVIRLGSRPAELVAFNATVHCVAPPTFTLEPPAEMDVTTTPAPTPTTSDTSPTATVTPEVTQTATPAMTAFSTPTAVATPTMTVEIPTATGNMQSINTATPTSTTTTTLSTTTNIATATPTVTSARRRRGLLQNATPTPTPTPATTMTPLPASTTPPPAARDCLSVTGTQNGLASNSMLLLGGINWEAGQGMRVSVPDNAYADGLRRANITHSLASDDPEYALLPRLSPQAPWTLEVEIVDDDAAGVLYDRSLAVLEGGGPSQFLVRLATTPRADVHVAFALEDPVGRLTLGATTLTWTPETWDASYVMEVITTTDDQVFTGSSSARITLTAASADPLYDGLELPDVEVRVDDNDAARVVLDRSGLPPGDEALQLAEGGSGATIPVYLGSRPVAGAVVRVQLLSGGQVTLVPSEIVFTAANFSTPVAVAVRALDDAAIEESTHSDEIGVLVSSTDEFYDGMQVAPLRVEIAENDASDGGSEVGVWGAVVCPTQPCGAVTLTVPPGAVPPGSSARVALSEHEPPVPTGTPLKVGGTEGLRLSAAFALTPHGAAFRAPLSLAIQYDTAAADAALRAESTWSLAFYRKASPSEGAWERVEAGESSFSSGLGVVTLESFSLWYIGVGPRGDGPVLAPPPLPASAHVPPLDATDSVRSGAIAIGTLLALLNAALVVALVWCCCCRASPGAASRDDDEEEDEEDERDREEFNKFLALTDANTVADLDDMQKLPPPPSQPRPIALPGPYSGGNAITDAHLHHNPEHFEPRSDPPLTQLAEADAPALLSRASQPGGESHVGENGSGGSGSRAAVPPVASDTEDDSRA